VAAVFPAGPPPMITNRVATRPGYVSAPARGVCVTDEAAGGVAGDTEPEVSRPLPCLR
jgi:hypothetical protein